MSLSEFEFGNELGKGAFSSVHVVKRKVDGKTYAMKRVRINQLSTRERENAMNEIRLLASLSHINIIGYKEAFFDEISRTMNIVMELADDGDILSKIQAYTQSKLYFRESTIWSILIQMLQGLKYLHDNNIMHRDLKSANVFLMKSGTVKIGDLNVSKIAKMGMASTQTGTPFYASPEVWKDKPYDYKSDIWSIGCIIYEMSALKTPFRAPTITSVFANVLKGTYEPIPFIYSKELGKIISYMLQVNPIARLTCDQLLKTDLIEDKAKTNTQYVGTLTKSQMGSRVELIKTIKIPKNLREINRTLPTSQYEDTGQGGIKSYNDRKCKQRNLRINSSSNKKKKVLTEDKLQKPNKRNIKIQINDISQDRVGGQGVEGVNESANMIYQKPILTNSSGIQKPILHQSKITIANSRLDNSHNRNKNMKTHISPCSNVQKPVTPIRLSKDSTPNSHNKSANRKVYRPISSISNNQQKLQHQHQQQKDQRAITPYSNKRLNKSFTRKQQPERVGSRPIVGMK